MNIVVIKRKNLWSPPKIDFAVNFLYIYSFVDGYL
jgi:hypothetical protein